MNYKLLLFAFVAVLQLGFADCVEYATCTGASSTALSQSVSWVAGPVGTSSIIYRICATHPSDLRFAENMHLGVYDKYTRPLRVKIERSFPLCTVVQDCSAIFDSNGCINGRVDIRMPVVDDPNLRSEITLNEIGSAGITLLKLCSV